MNNKKIRRSVRMTSRVTPDEFNQVVALSNRAGLSMSEFIRRVCLGQVIESKVDSKAVLDLLKVNADLGRLGGLLKLWLTEPDRNAADVRKLLHEIMEAKDTLVGKVNQL